MHRELAGSAAVVLVDSLMSAKGRSLHDQDTSVTLGKPPFYNGAMLLRRLVSALALLVWIGGAISIVGVLAPAAFAVLPSTDAARLVGETLRRFHIIGYGAGAALVASFVLAGLIGPRPYAFWARLWIAALMLATTLISGLWVNAHIAALRDEIGAPVTTLAPGDARRIAFGRWHAVSTVLMALTIAGGLVLVYWEARETA
jgi:hypothetical protein